jgi:hypothetical protein
MSTNMPPFVIKKKNINKNKNEPCTGLFPIIWKVGLAKNPRKKSLSNGLTNKLTSFAVTKQGGH